MRTTKRIMAMAAMLLSMSQAWALGPATFYNFKAAVKTSPVGAGKVYVRSADTGEAKPANAQNGEQFNQANQEGYIDTPTAEEVEIAVTSTYKDIYVLPTANAGYVFGGFVTEATYNATAQHWSTTDDFIGEIQGEGEKQGSYSVAGYYKITVNVDRTGHSNSDSNDTGFKETRYTEGQDYSMPEGVDVTYYALFFPEDAVPTSIFYAYPAQQKPGNCGTIGTVTISDEVAAIGQQLTLTAVPVPGCEFVKWKKNDGTELTDNPLTFTATAGEYYTPEFKISTVHIGAKGVASYCNAKGFSFSSDKLKAYPAKVENGYVVLLNGFNGAPNSDGDLHPCILVGEEGDYDFNFTADGGELGFYHHFSPDAIPEGMGYDDDKLLGTPKATVTADGKQYVLADGTNGVGFYHLAVGEVIPTNKAYIELDEADAKDFLPLDGETTAIANMINPEKKNTVYNLQGQKVSDNYRGIVIMNGKKYFNK